MEMLKYILVGLFAYLCGSFSTSIFIGKVLYNIDVRQYGSGNAGATNTLRTLGAKKAIIVLFGDIVKVIIPVLVAVWAGVSEPALYAGSFALLGHSLPVYYGFKGGKGVACAAATVLMFDWRVLLVLLALFIITFIISKMVSLSTLVAVIAVQPIIWLLPYSTWSTRLYFGLIGIYIVYLHRENIKRILKGEEKRITKGVKPLKDIEKGGK